MTTTPALPKKAGHVDLDRTRERLVKLGLAHAAERLAEHVAEAVKETAPPHRFLDRLLEEELVQRDERRVKTSLRLSGLPVRCGCARPTAGSRSRSSRGATPRSIRRACASAST